MHESLNVVIASVVRASPSVLRAFSRSHRELRTPGLTIGYLFVDDNPDPDSSAMLAAFARESGTEVLSSACRENARHCDLAGPRSSQWDMVTASKPQWILNLEPVERFDPRDVHLLREHTLLVDEDVVAFDVAPDPAAPPVWCPLLVRWDSSMFWAPADVKPCRRWPATVLRRPAFSSPARMVWLGRSARVACPMSAMGGAAP